MIMSLFGMGKRPRHKSFDYIPRYYDPEKEERQSRINTLKGQTNQSDSESAKARIRGSFRKPISRSYETDQYKKTLRRSRKMVLAITLILLLLCLYFILEYLPNFLEAFE